MPAADNPGLVLGAVMGVCAARGRDKLTLITPRRIYDFGAWLEQLVAESTGKQGQGIIPVDREPLGSPAEGHRARVPPARVTVRATPSPG